MAYTYKKKITITGQSGAGTDYQVLLNVGESSGSSGANFHLEGNSLKFPTTKNDGGDIKFFANDESTVLKFWVESVSGSSPNRTAKIWVKVTADLGSNQDIYIYYGDSGASNLSNGDDTFIFFDDFDTGSIDTGKWNVTSGTFSQSSSEITGVASNPAESADTNGKYTLTTEASRGVALRFNIRRTGSCDTNFSLEEDSSNRIRLGNTSYNGQGVYSYGTGRYSLAQTGLGNNTTGNHLYDLKVNGTSMYINQSSGISSSRVLPNSVNSRTFYFLIGSGDSNYPMNYIDFVISRRFITTEPSYNSAGSQTFVIPPTSPTVTTSPVTNIATNSGLGNGNVTDDGNATITERGICWNTSPNPTTADSKSIATGTTGAFSADIHSLTTGTTYYVRAYATNSVGTSYGSEVTFSPSQVSLQQESGGFIKQENGRTFIF